MEKIKQTIGLKALEIAISQLGQMEEPKGSNKGPMVDKYLASVGLDPGYAWCQAFVYWCYQQAGLALGVNNPAIHTAGVHDCWNHTTGSKRLSKIVAINRPELVSPGDQFILMFGSASGHTGLIESVDGYVIYTIEGNSNTDGSREGYEVVRHQRKLTDNALVGIIRYTPGP